MAEQAFRGQIFYFIDDPQRCGDDAWRYFQDGILWIKEGRIYRVGDAQQLKTELPADLPIDHHPNHLLMPGFIDTHIHYPQTEMIAAFGDQLLSWLEHYTFPTEAKFADAEYSEKIAAIFLDQLIANGTTTAMVFGSVHPQSVDALFTKALQRQMRLIAGKVMMDRNAPAELLDTATTSYQQSVKLIERWHGNARLSYALTPRFAPTSTPEQLRAVAQLKSEYPDLYIQTHLSENLKECAWVQELYPDSRDYLDVYEQAGLLSDRSVFAHGIHLSDDAMTRLSQSGSIISHCPSSNLFLGSGLLPMQALEKHHVALTIGTDVGAGTSFSMLKTLSDSYKVQQLQGVSLSPFQAFYRATLGAAKALKLDQQIGNFESGKEADFIAIDLHASDFLRFRFSHCETIEQLLFAIMILGDDRLIANTWIMGEPQKER